MGRRGNEENLRKKEWRKKRVQGGEKKRGKKKTKALIERDIGRQAIEEGVCKLHRNMTST